MNILYYFKDYENYMSAWQHVHIIDELQRNGHNIKIYNPLLFNTLEESNEKLTGFIKNSPQRFDLFLNCEGDYFLYPQIVQAVKKMGLPTALICFDNLHAPFLHRKIAPLFDAVWLTSHETKAMFEKWGCKNIIIQPYAANPYKFRPNWTTPKNTVSFVGSPYGSRISTLNFLTKNKISCDIFSSQIDEKGQKTEHKIISQKISVLEKARRAMTFDIGRKVFFSDVKNKILKPKQVLNKNENLHLHSSVSFDEMQQIYSNSTLSLNITTLGNTYLLKKPLHKLHLRTFEIPMCGGLEIAFKVEELTDYFEDGKEIVFYRTDEELISKAKFYLDTKQENIVKKMKQNARYRAENEHTWNKRFEKLFEIL